MAIGSGGYYYYREEGIGVNYGDDDICDYDDVGYGDGVGGNEDDYDDNDDDAVWRLAIGSGGYYGEEWCR